MSPVGRRALFVLTDTSPYGASRVAAAYRRGLLDAGWTVDDVDRWGRGPAPDDLASEGPADPSPPVDLVVAVHLASGPGAAWLARRHGAALVVLAQNQLRFRGPRLVRGVKRRVHRLAVDRADAVVAVSAQVAGEIRSSCGPRRVVVIDNAVADPGPVEVDRSATTIVAVGRLHPQKGFDLLVAAMPKVLAAEPAARLEIVGGEVPGAPGYRHLLEALAERLGVADAIDFVGLQHDVDARLAGAAVAVVPSRWDGRSLAALEAMAAGVPVVVSDRCGVDGFVDGTHGALVETAGADVASALDDPVVPRLADAVVWTLASSPSDRAARAAAARHLALARTPDQMASEFAELVGELTKTR
ncbi:MAG: glycosyltransferase family 4 protein [Acidimicrobiales bacterium]